MSGIGGGAPLAAATQGINAKAASQVVRLGLAVPLKRHQAAPTAARHKALHSGGWGKMQVGGEVVMTLLLPPQCSLGCSATPRSSRCQPPPNHTAPDRTAPWSVPPAPLRCTPPPAAAPA